MKYSEIERKLKKVGCYCVDESGNHPLWYSTITGKKFSLSHHKSEEVKTGTKKAISSFSGVEL